MSYCFGGNRQFCRKNKGFVNQIMFGNCGLFHSDKGNGIRGERGRDLATRRQVMYYLCKYIFCQAGFLAASGGEVSVRLGHAGLESATYPPCQRRYLQRAFECCKGGAN